MAPVVIRIGRSRSVAALDHRVAHGLPLGAQLVGELDDQDAVLGDQADQGDEADLAIDVERAAAPPQRQQRAGDRQRHGQHDDERIGEALELRREHEIDEGEREQEGQVDARAGFLEFARLARHSRYARSAGSTSLAAWSRKASAVAQAYSRARAAR